MNTTSASFTTTNGVSSFPLTGTNRRAWVREIKAMYADGLMVTVWENGTVKAMRQGGRPFALGHITVHTTEEN